MLEMRDAFLLRRRVVLATICLPACTVGFLMREMKGEILDEGARIRDKLFLISLRRNSTLFLDDGRRGNSIGRRPVFG